jgi:hypothetical protein
MSMARRDLTLVAGDTGTVLWGDYLTGTPPQTIHAAGVPTDPIGLSVLVLTAVNAGTLTITATATTVRVQSSNGADGSTVRVIGEHHHSIGR